MKAGDEAPFLVWMVPILHQTDVQVNVAVGTQRIERVHKMLLRRTNERAHAAGRIYHEAQVHPVQRIRAGDYLRLAAP